MITSCNSLKGPFSLGQRFLVRTEKKEKGLDSDSAREVMARRVADVAFKALTAGLGVATIYLTATFSINVYRGFSWHSAQSVISQKLFLCLLTTFPLNSLLFDNISLRYQIQTRDQHYMCHILSPCEIFFEVGFIMD
jgi:hypothetical protein